MKTLLLILCIFTYGCAEAKKDETAPSGVSSKRPSKTVTMTYDACLEIKETKDMDFVINADGEVYAIKESELLELNFDTGRLDLIVKNSVISDVCKFYITNGTIQNIEEINPAPTPTPLPRPPGYSCGFCW